MRHSLLVFVVTVLVVCNSSSANDRERAKSIVQKAIEREKAALQGLHWEWTRERGKSASLDDALQGKRLAGEPVDKYRHRWLSNGGVFYYASIAQQEPRVLERNKKQQVITTTEHSEVYLSTYDSRLVCQPDPIAPRIVLIESRTHNFSDRWGPHSIPVHAGQFGFGLISVLMKNVSDPAIEVSVREGETDAGAGAIILEFEKYGALHRYYFAKDSLVVLQAERIREKRITHKTLVTATKELAGVDATLVLPVQYISCFKVSGQPNWYMTRVQTSEIRRRQVPFKEMAIPVSNTDFYLLNPDGSSANADRGKDKTDSVDEITPRNLDSLVDKLIPNRAQSGQK